LEDRKQKETELKLVAGAVYTIDLPEMSGGVVRGGLAGLRSER